MQQPEKQQGWEVMTLESILIVEDDETLARVLKDAFTRRGYRVATAADGQAGLDAILNTKPDLVILDVMLPKIDGYEICRMLREEKLDTLVLMLTAKSQESDVILGLDTGSDDYMTKPFSTRELLARANALLRRRREADLKVLRFGPFELDLTSHQLMRAGEEIALSPKEFQVLELFARNPGRAFSREETLRRVWGYSVLVTPRSVDRAVNTLRMKLEQDPQNPQYILTVRQVGYRFDPDGPERDS